MKYLILIYSNPQSRAIWTSFSADQQADGIRLYNALSDELIASGELIVTEALADASEGKRLPATEEGWGTTATDGPYAEVKEQLAGFFLLECKSFDRALEIAARIPEAPLGLVELRPVMAPGGLEM